MLHNWTRIRLAIFAFAAALGAAFLLPANAQDDGSVVEQILARGKMRVGMSSFTPWAIRAKNGDFIGFEIDVARAVADDLGVELELVPTAWDGIIPALLAGKFDVIIGGMSITPARNLKINFTAPYAHSGIDLAANRSKAGNAKTLADFNKAEIVIAMRRGINAVQTVRQMMPNAEIRQFDDEATVIRETINGNAHAMVGSAPWPAFAAVKNPQQLFLPFDEPIDKSSEAIGLRKGDADSLNFFNNWILLRTQNGWLKSRHDYWFRARDWADLVGEN